MEYPQQYTIASRGVRVVFERRDDRWAHRVELTSSEVDPVPLIESVEGAPSCSAPPSPPIQELQMHGERDAPTLLGVGMAGRSHWSVTCGVRQVQGSIDGEDSICIEVACRVKDQNCILSSQYRLAPHVELTALDDGTMLVTFANRSLRIRPHGAAASAREGGFVIHTYGTKRAVPRTEQWSYSVVPTSSVIPTSLTAGRES